MMELINIKNNNIVFQQRAKYPSLQSYNKVLRINQVYASGSQNMSGSVIK